LRENPVVPAVRGPNGALEEALKGDHAAIFVLGGDVFRVIERSRREPKRPLLYVNVDLVGGVAADASGMRFLARYVEGVISTHRHVIELAKGAGLVTIQRLFAIDSGAVDRGLKLIKRADPDAVEILPALAFPEIAARCSGELNRPTLAGGLIRDPKAIHSILGAGAAGVSTSDPALWEPWSLS
jgi:glycerol uptake operon antiterminator